MSDEEKVKYVLTLDVPGTPKGHGIEIPGLGVFANGDEHEITEAQARSYRAANPVAQAVVGDNNEILGVDVKQGSTLLQASRRAMEGITVSTYDESDPEDEEDEDVEEPEPEPDPDEGNTLVEDNGLQLSDDVLVEGSDD